MTSTPYLDAAQLVGYTRPFRPFACNAISRALGAYDSDANTSTHRAVARARRKFSDMFAPSKAVNPTNSSVWGEFFGETEAEQHDCRVLALLLMHWMTQ